MSKNRTMAAIVLSAGKGTRIGQHLPKSLYPIIGKPMLYYCLDLVKKIPIPNVYVVVGYKAIDVKASIRNEEVKYVYQKTQLGTAHAAKLALDKVAETVDDVIIFNGDDSAFFEVSTIRKLIASHVKTSAKISFMSSTVDKPTGLGRVLRINGKVSEIVEEKDCSEDQKLIKEVNVGCYVFDKNWLRDVITKVVKSASGEYYITDLISMALSEGIDVNNFCLEDKREWRGINDQNELKEANEKMLTRLVKQKESTVFIFDIDNTLINTDLLKKLVSEKLVKNLIEEKYLKIFWEEYELSRNRLGYVSIPEFSDSFAERIGREEYSNKVRQMFYTVPFNKFVYNGVEDLMEYIDPKGEIVILTEGDLVYQPMKIKNLKISRYLDEMFVFENKLKSLYLMDIIYKDRRKIVVDDKITNLEAIKNIVKNSIVIHVKQGKYVDLVPNDKNFKADCVAHNIDEASKYIRSLY